MITVAGKRFINYCNLAIVLFLQAEGYEVRNKWHKFTVKKAENSSYGK